MNRRRPIPHSDQAKIAHLMEDAMDMGVGSFGAATPAVSSTTIMMQAEPVDDMNEEDVPEGFTEDELKIAKRFLELIGGADRAREAIDKVDECSDCLGLLDDEEADESDSIENMAKMMPGLPDLPTGSTLGMSSLYNSNALGAPSL